MKFISLTGPKTDIDRVVNNYLSKYEIHLENALTELQEVKGLSPYIEENPYKEYLEKVNRINELVNQGLEVEPKEMTVEEAVELVDRLDGLACISDDALEELRKKEAKLDEAIKTIEPYRQIPYDLSSLLDFKFVHYRFGKIPKEYYKKFHDYVYENEDTFFYKCSENEDFVWGVYFVPDGLKIKTDAAFSSMHFERNFMPDEYQGTPEEAYEELIKEKSALLANIDACKLMFLDDVKGDAAMILGAKRKLEMVAPNFDVRKMAASTISDQMEFYILCGWISKRDFKSLSRDIEDDEKIFFMTQRDSDIISSKTPTKLKNTMLVRPFEMFTKMYGLPAYNEIDPTFFIAITYSIIFGAMFGDVGQGLVLVLIGALLYKLKNMKLGAIMCNVGISSTIFGFLYGSVFGFEDWIEAVWLRPIEHMTEVPMIGRLNTVFVVAIGLGMFLIMLTMIFNVINGIKAREVGETLFDKSSVAGLVFYSSLFAICVLLMQGKNTPAGWVLAIMFGLPLVIIFLKEPLTKLLTKEKSKEKTSVGMFITQGIFELFEVLLSYFSNTLSFVRIGAFAVSHAAMMEVVLMLANVESGSPNILVIILGNIFVMALEGLIVGIQVLRLEYYEMFSRFYRGTGKRFVSTIHRSKS
jgi:V/A-type H+-transporting ATPase subunit I